MARPRVRPRFELDTELSAEEVVARVQSALTRERGAIVGVFVPGRIELSPHPSKTSFWSPQLHVTLKPQPAGTTLAARFSPHPPTWTLYVAVHAIGAFLTIFAAVFGFSQYVAGETPWALWALPISPVLAALVWALAFVGQSLSADEMYGLRRFLEEALS